MQNTNQHPRGVSTMMLSTELMPHIHRRRSDWNSGGTHGWTCCRGKNTFSYIVMQVIWCLKFCNMTKSGGTIPRSKFRGDIPHPLPVIYAHAHIHTSFLTYLVKSLHLSVLSKLYVSCSCLASRNCRVYFFLSAYAGKHIFVFFHFLLIHFFSFFNLLINKRSHLQQIVAQAELYECLLKPCKNNKHTKIKFN